MELVRDKLMFEPPVSLQEVCSSTLALSIEKDRLHHPWERLVAAMGTRGSCAWRRASF